MDTQEVQRTTKANQQRRHVSYQAPSGLLQPKSINGETSRKMPGLDGQQPQISFFS